MRRASLLLALVCVAGPAAAQYDLGPNQTPRRVSVSDLLSTPGLYHDKLVLVRGRVHPSDMVDLQNEIYLLRDREFLREVRMGEGGFSMTRLRFLDGQDVEVLGIFWDLTQAATNINGVWRPLDPRLRNFPGALRQDMELEDRRYFIGVISVESLEIDVVPNLEEEEPDIVDPDIALPDSALVDLRELVAHPEPYLGKRIAVVGKFRGNNLYGDLSIRDKKTPRDFVIKVADKAIWVTGRRPRGKEFRLDANKRRDTGKWLKVIGVPWEDEGTVYLRAEKIELVPEPEDPSLAPIDVEDLVEEKDLGPPPDVIFSLPLDGETNVALDTTFRVQFSKDMNRQSFDRNVDLLYAEDDDRANPFPALEIDYEAGSRTLVVRPGARLEPGREILLILYRGIVDEDGQPLAVRPDAEAVDPDAAVVLRFRTAS